MIPETFQRLRDSERAVSPVIGVILMVAITVILAAVVATFALGFAGDSTDSPPQASISADTEHTENVTVTNDAGDPVDLSETVLRPSSGEDHEVSNDTELSPGQSITLEHDDDFDEGELEPGEEYSLVWTNGDDTILATFEVPEDA